MLLLSLLLLLSLRPLLSLLLLSLWLLARSLVKYVGQIVAVCLLGKPQIGHGESCVFRAKENVGLGLCLFAQLCGLNAVLIPHGH